MLTITANDLRKKREEGKEICIEGINWIEKNYPNGISIKAIEEKGVYPNYKDLSWLLKHCPEYRTEEMLDLYLKIFNNDYYDLSWLLSECPEYRTRKILDLYLKIFDNNYYNLRCLLDECPEYRKDSRVKEILKKKRYIM